MTKEKRKLLDALKRLIDEVPGTEASWEVALEFELAALPVRTLEALLYRVERSLAQSYDEGHAAGASFASGLGP